VVRPALKGCQRGYELFTHQRVLLRLAGCDEMQGFLFAKPAPAKFIDKLLAQAKQGGKPLSASGEALTA
jgi:predicted signal transduction protein with EAL and GGDEF domain